MKRLLPVFLLGLCVMQFACASARRGEQPVMRAEQPVTVAVVSLLVDATAAMLPEASGGARAALLEEGAGQMLLDTERRIAREWQVVAAESFTGSEAYRSLSTGLLQERVTASVGGSPLGVFAEDLQAQSKARISAEAASELCAAAGADAVLVVFSEWGVRVAGNVPQPRPHSRNTVSLWDRSGTQLFVRRADKLGRLPVGSGGAGRVAETSGALDAYLDSYRQALDVILK